MTIQEAIATVDDLKPNQYEHHHKVRWLSTVDGRIYNEIMSHFKKDDDMGWEPYSENTDVSMELLAPEPYSEIYIYYMTAMIDWWNGEYSRYNSSLAMFNESFQAYSDDYAKDHESLGIKKFRL